MTDERDLLRAIPENPADDVVRLVYADWLEEHGGTLVCPKCKGTRIERRYESVGREFSGFSMEYRSYDCPCGTGTVPDGRREQAEFIRVQCRIAEMEAAVAEQRKNAIMGGCCERFANNQACDCPSGPEVDALRKRERELWMAREWSYLPVGWQPSFSVHIDQTRPYDSGGATVALVRRGWVESVRLPLAAFLGGTCERCRTWTTGPNGERPPCGACSGTGRVGGCITDLFASQPVLSVVATDREAIRASQATHDTRVEIYKRRGRNSPVGYFLEDEIFDKLTAGELVTTAVTPDGEPVGQCRVYPTREAFNADFSAALVAHGRQLAGLTALPSPEQIARTRADIPG